MEITWKINIPIGLYQIAFLHAYVLSLIRSGCNLKLQVVKVSAFQSTLSVIATIRAQQQTADLANVQKEVWDGMG